MKNKTRFLLLVLAGTLIAPNLKAAYDDLGVSARAVGMGNAFTAVADDAYDIYYNPAGLATLDRAELVTTYAQFYPGLTDSSNLSNSFFGYAQPIDEGRQGTLGLGYNRFSLNGFYQESSLYLSYGREINTEGLLPGHLYGGVTMKYLDRSLSGLGTLNSAPLGPTGIAQPGSVDPVLNQTARSNFDMDMGLLYRPLANWDFGFASQHIFEPNIAFDPAQGETLARDYKFGAAYRTPFTTLTGEYDIIQEPTMTMGEIISLGAEKWFPTLAHGTFGIRGGLSEGSLDFRQISMGLSYRIFKMQFDYGFELPLSGISMSAYGTQRFGMSFRFGESPEEHAAYGEALLENTGELAEVGTPEFKYQEGRLLRFEQDAVANFVKQAHDDAEKGKFALALDRINQAISLSPKDMVLSETQARLAVVSAVYPELKDFGSSDVKASLYVGIIHFLSGNNKKALEHMNYVIKLAPNDQKLKDLLKAMEALTGEVPPTPAPTPASATPIVKTPSPTPAPATPKAATTTTPEDQYIQGALSLMEVNLDLKQYDKVIAMGEGVVKIDPTNALAYLRMGAAYYALKEYSKAQAAFKKSHQYETNPESLKKIEAALDALRNLVKSEKKNQGHRIKKSTASPQEIENLYQAGVTFYAEGQLKEAENAFQKLLDIAPNYVPAQRALQRVRAEESQAGGL